MHIIWCPLNLLISPVAWFTVYCVTVSLLRLRSIFPSCHMGSPFHWAYNVFGWRHCRLQLCTCMFKICSLIKDGLNSGNTCHDFPAHNTLHTATTTNVMTLNVMWKLAKLFLWPWLVNGWWTIWDESSAISIMSWVKGKVVPICT